MGQSWRERAHERINDIRVSDVQIRVTMDGEPVPDATVQLQMKEHAFGFGTAISAKHLMADDSDGEQYREFVERCNRVTFENDLKWEPWAAAEASPEKMATLEDAVTWLAHRDIPIRGHYVHWAVIEGGSLPTHVAEGYDGDAAALYDVWMDNIRERVPQAAALGNIFEWDVINHPVGWSGRLPRTEAEFGTDFYAELFDLADDLVPDSDHWINEGSILSGLRRVAAYERVIEDLIERDQGPDGIGFMGHFSEPNLPSMEELEETLDRFANLVPRLQITELDVTADTEKRMAEYFGDVLTLAYSHPAMEAVILWGFWAGRHWRPETALYDEEWNLRPVGRVWHDLVYDEWWSDVHGQTDGDGLFADEVFHGIHEITVDVDGASTSEIVSITDQQTVDISI